MLIIPYCVDVDWFSSTFNFPKTKLPFISVASSSRIGANILQGPHQGAQKSTKTGTGGRRAHAEDLARKQRDISVSEFFTKNRHLLGFDNPRKALLTTIKEAVDNSLDACEEAGILPDVTVEIQQAPAENGRKNAKAAAEGGPEDGKANKAVVKLLADRLEGARVQLAAVD